MRLVLGVIGTLFLFIGLAGIAAGEAVSFVTITCFVLAGCCFYSRWARSEASARIEVEDKDEREHTGLIYEDFAWGNPPPTRKQFGYAVHLGVDIQDGMTKTDISRAITLAVAEKKNS